MLCSFVVLCVANASEEYAQRSVDTDGCVRDIFVGMRLVLLRMVDLGGVVSAQSGPSVGKQSDKCILTWCL